MSLVWTVPTDSVFVKSMKPIAPMYGLQTEYFIQNVHCNQYACSRSGLDMNQGIEKEYKYIKKQAPWLGSHVGIFVFDQTFQRPKNTS